MSASDFLLTLVQLFEAAQIPYMLTGSFASAFHGRPRATQDIDIVVAIDRSSLQSLLSALPESRFYLSEDAAQEAIRLRRQFNVIDMQSGWKADLIVLKRRSFSEEEFGRRQRAHVLGVDLWIASAEDTVLAKLEWSLKSGGSERQLADAAGILEICAEQLDLDYVERWLDPLRVRALWERIRPAT